MALRVTCSCSRVIAVKDELSGKKIRCPDCAAVLLVPAAEEETPAEQGITAQAAPPVATASSAPPALPKAAAPRRKRYDDDYDDEDDDRPRRRPRIKKDSSSMLPLILVGGALLLVLLLGGGGLLAIFFLRAAPPPAPIFVQPPVPFFPPPNPAPFNPNFPRPLANFGPINKGPAIFNVATALTANDPIDARNGFGRRCKTHTVQLTAGKTYVIEMNANQPGQIDPYLRLEDARGVQLALDDDSGGNLNARLVYAPAQTGPYNIIATTFGPGVGPYTLTVSEVR